MGLWHVQRHDVVIDACLVGGFHSSLLQQACQLTGGIYTRPARPAVLVAYLLVTACSNTYLRVWETLQLQPAMVVDQHDAVTR